MNCRRGRSFAEAADVGSGGGSGRVLGAADVGEGGGG
jgi:hypothetical protein